MSTTVKIESELFKTIKEIAKSGNISEDKALNEVLEKGIKELKKELLFKKIEAKGGSISNKDTYGKGDSEDICGLGEAPKGFDSVKAVNDMKSGIE